MSFPQYRRCFFGLLSRPDGWQDRGAVQHLFLNGGAGRRYTVHALCNTRLRIAIEEGEPFRYCPRCRIRVPE